jgi:NADH:ubiquinone oxidoreductase subunit 4 (subunit M)
VDFLYKRFGARGTHFVHGVVLGFPNLANLYTLSTCVIIGLPGTILFNLKVIFFSQLMAISSTYFILLVFFFFVVLPIFFIKLFLVITGGSLPKTFSSMALRSSDLSKMEILMTLTPILICAFLTINVALLV